MKSVKIFLTLFAVLGVANSSSAQTCEAGWQKIETATENFCIQTENTSADVLSYKAPEVCEGLSAKVCSTEQWIAACNTGILTYQGWEWAIAMGQYQSLIGRQGCYDIAFGELSHVAHLRCCRK